jgi:hypothetical protein
MCTRISQPKISKHKSGCLIIKIQDMVFTQVIKTDIPNRVLGAAASQ